MSNEWIYKTNKDNTARYTLGKQGKRNLICIGINPHYAEPNNLDHTLKRVRNISKNNGYDGWLMLNLYPQRGRYAVNVIPSLQKQIISDNIYFIKEALTLNSYKDVWAAWGGDITEHKYFKYCLEEIYKVLNDDYNWMNYGDLAYKDTHPRHPSRTPDSLTFKKFDIAYYLKEIL
ncbi:DUF1643 domain-containing protein [Mesonia sp. K7]|uniref:DUF1643 domain-containing protein n=1 Tax=Mesonia sp. K7 TaxID=2218606 RepID=UPI000DA9B1EB|nr:DUF1643 domain-containing protein [Mesonia sp. K7]PZD79657.1 hypothetical protein DNG35_01230 [Mesonia sp. K7]